MASKLPYFRMFPKDFTTDECVMLMNLEETGLYIKCLNHTWTNGSIPAELSLIAKLFNIKTTTVKKCWPQMACKFVPGLIAGTLVNPRLEKERAHIIARSEEASKNAQRRVNSKGNSPEIEKCTASTSPDLALVATNGFSGRSARASESESESESSVMEGGVGETEEIYPEDPPEKFMEEAVSRERPGFRVKFSRKSDIRIVERIQGQEELHGQRPFRCGWLAFVRWWKRAKPDKIRDAVAYYLDHLASWLPEENTPPEAEAPESHPEAPLRVELALVRNYLAEWNAAVPQALATWHAKYSPTAALRECSEDPEFQSSFGGLCVIAERIHAARGAEVGWLTFEWLLKAKAGESPGWLKLRGMGWMAKESSDDRMVREIEEEQRRTA